MPNPQLRAVQNYRARLAEKGLARFEVLGRDADRELIRRLARRLVKDDSHAQEMRVALTQSVAEEHVASGSILAALRASPLVGADLDFSRAQETGRRVEL